MGLLGNGCRHNLTGRITTATTNIDGCNASCIPASYNLTAMRRNMLVGSGIANPQASMPQGVRPPIAWLMAKEGGGISSYRRADISISGTANAEMGFPRTGTATISINGTAIGGLIVGATGTTTISINGTADAFGAITGEGATTISITGSADLGAIASLVGETTISINGSAEIMGIGYMTGTTIETGELTPEGIATAVWRALAADNNETGTMGSKLNTASSGGVDLDALAQAVWGYATRSMTTTERDAIATALLAAAQITPIHADARKVHGITVGGSGTELDPWGPA